MKKGDFIILFVLIFVVFASFFILTYNGKDIKNVKVVIKVDGEIYKEIKLTDNYNNFIEINSKFGYNKISIEKNGIKMVDANCNDKLCVAHKEISKPHQSLICLPNRVIVYIEGSSELHYVSY